MKIKHLAIIITILTAFLAVSLSEASSVPKQEKPKYKRSTRISIGGYPRSPESLAWRIVREQKRIEREQNKDYRKP